jgi:hypothetical protein
MIQQLGKLLVLLLALSQYPVLGQGFIEDSAGYIQKLSTPKLSRAFTILPDSFSLKSYCPEPLKQFLPACVGYSIAYAAAIRRNALQNITDRKEKQSTAFAPLFIYNQAVLSKDGCNHGTTFKKGFDVALDKGMDIYEPWAERNCRDLPDSDELERAAHYQIAGSEKIEAGDSQQLLLLIKKMLFEKNPVLAGMCLDSLIFRMYRGNANQYFALRDTQRAKIYHAVTIIGYNEKQQAFEIVNSYGRSWGNGGFFSMKYDDFLKAYRECYYIVGQRYRENNSSYNITRKLSGTFELICNGHVSAAQMFSETGKLNTLHQTVEFRNGVRNGDELRFIMRAEQPCYLYLVHRGTSGEVSTLFPFQDNLMHFSSFLPHSSSVLTFPDDNHTIVVEGAPGTEVLFLLMATSPLDIDKVVQNAPTINGIEANMNLIRSIVKPLPLMDAYCTLSPSGAVQFQTTEFSGDCVLPVILYIPHQ